MESRALFPIIKSPQHTNSSRRSTTNFFYTMSRNDRYDPYSRRRRDHHRRNSNTSLEDDFARMDVSSDHSGRRRGAISGASPAPFYHSFSDRHPDGSSHNSYTDANGINSTNNYAGFDRHPHPSSSGRPHSSSGYGPYHSNTSSSSTRRPHTSSGYGAYNSSTSSSSYRPYYGQYVRRDSYSYNNAYDRYAGYGHNNYNWPPPSRDRSPTGMFQQPNGPDPYRDRSTPWLSRNGNLWSRRRTEPAIETHFDEHGNSFSVQSSSNHVGERRRSSVGQGDIDEYEDEYTAMYDD